MDELKMLVVKLSEGLKALGEMIGTLGKEVEAYAASKPEEKKAVAAEAPAVAPEPKKTPSKKKPAAKKAPKPKRTAAKTPKAPKAKKPSETKEKTKAPSASDVVLEIIRAEADGASIPMLQEKTGFDKKKVTNCLHRLKKAGMVKNAAKGVYTGV